MKAKYKKLWIKTPTGWRVKFRQVKKARTPRPEKPKREKNPVEKIEDLRRSENYAQFLQKVEDC